MSKKLLFSKKKIVTTSVLVSLCSLSLVLSSCGVKAPDISDDESDSETAQEAKADEKNADSADKEKTAENSAADSTSDVNADTPDTEALINLSSKSRQYLSALGIKEDDSYFYYTAMSKLWRTSKKDHSDTKCIFPDDSTSATVSSGFAVYKGNVYLVGFTSDDYSYKLYRVDNVGSVSQLDTKEELNYATSTEAYDDKLYLYSFSRDNDHPEAPALHYDGYVLNPDGSVGERIDDYEDFGVELPDNATPLSYAYGTYVCSPSSIEMLGGLYYTDAYNSDLPDDKSGLYFMPSDDQSNPRYVAAIGDSNLGAVTDKSIVMISTDVADKCVFSIDLSTGERTDLLTDDELEAMGYRDSTWLNVIDYDDEQIFLMIDQPLTEEPVPNIVYDVIRIDLTGDTNDKICSIKKVGGADDYASSTSYNYTSEGLTYVGYADNDLCLCARGYDDLGRELVLAKTNTVEDNHFADYGITTKSIHYARYYEDDDRRIKVFEADMTIPQLPETSEDFKDFNQKMLDDAMRSADDDAQMAVGDAKDFFENYSEDDGYYGFLAYSYSFSSDSLSYYDDRYVCLNTSDYDFMGGAHGLGWEYSYVFDMQEGKVLELGDIIGDSHEDFVELVCGHVTDLDRDELFKSYEETADQVREDYEGRDFNWFITPEGIGVRFSSYEIAPYASGYPEIIVPFDELTMKIQLG